MINGIKFFWLTSKQWCDDMTNGQGHDFTTDFQSDYPYFKEHYRLVAMN